MKPQKQCPSALAARPGTRRHSMMGSTARSRLMVPHPHPHCKGSHQTSRLMGHATLPVPYAWQLPWQDKFFPLRPALSHFHTDSSCPRQCHGPHSTPSLGSSHNPTVHSCDTSARGPGAPSAHAGSFWVAGHSLTGSCSSHPPMLPAAAHSEVLTPQPQLCNFLWDFTLHFLPRQTAHSQHSHARCLVAG